MRILSRLTVLVSAVFIFTFFSGCDPDTPGTPGGVTLNPIVSLNGGTDLVSFNTERSLSDPTFTVNVSGEDGDAALRDLAILQDGVVLTADSLNFRTGQTSNNPILTAGTDADGFTYEIDISPLNPAPGPVTFTFRLTDVDGEVGTTSVTVNYIVTGPTADLLIEDGFVSGDVTIVNSNPNFSVKLQYAKTEDDIASITVLEDGVAIDADRLTFNGGDFTAANPLTLIDGEREGGTFRINIRPDVTENTTRTYTFRVTDVNGVTTDRTVAVTYDIPPNDLTLDITGVFFNASGSMNGGLDLDNGTAVGFDSSDAEIEDEGININVAGENWRTQVSATNDAVLRIADFSVLAEGVSFDDIVRKADIAALFDGGAVPDGSDDFPNTDGDRSSDEVVTEALRENDVLAVRRGDRSYLVRIDAINFADGSNNDSYNVSIKW